MHSDRAYQLDEQYEGSLGQPWFQPHGEFPPVVEKREGNAKIIFKDLR